MSKGSPETKVEAGTKLEVIAILQSRVNNGLDYVISGECEKWWNEGSDLKEE